MTPWATRFMVFAGVERGWGALTGTAAAYWWSLPVAGLLALPAVLLWARRLRQRLEAARQAGPNEFQRSIDIGRVPVKNCGAELAGPRRPGRVRILSWNVERGYRPDQLADYLRDAQADVVCLQEVDWNCRRTRLADVLGYLADGLGMRGYLGIEFLEICTPLRPPGMAGGGVTGNALLVNAPAVAVFRIDLPAVMDWAFDWNAPPFSGRLWKRVRREKRVGGRFALAAELRLVGRPLVVCSTHLEDFTGGIAGRFSQYRCIVDEIERRYGNSAVRVIAGDFNTFDSPATRRFRGGGGVTAMGKPRWMAEARWWKTRLLPETGYSDPFDVRDWTFQVTPLFRPKLDWITVKGSRVLDRGIGPLGFSDHRPLWMDLEWRT